ncbi:mycothiol conjugate amidase Mca [Leucobacter luti]|uniref:Mycothiol S-conjugate amidase n=1 Tax=Leucobacter luti TaxID=340320 RepID=A0A4R6RUT5_9MICO|nr:mycothiol conjugate amidase Mca [Leucobacter luti]MCW2289895.1 mycothiol S-conjugate amidase [Leucobacter luti]QYM76963.1 mycothiol conjugate amidase Mca [Leucobacter luti]TCK36065.1 mycothiol S-conjugate amidase [Leucobacter luti]TDP89836.1 mycothiol S-conjugate amidase [Leucobacter luti]
MTLRLIAVHAHPDDESSKGAATYAHYLDLGVEVLIVSCTGGERGDVLNELVARDPKSRRDLAGLRRDEMARAQDIVGFEHRWLGYEDSGLPDEGEALPAGSFAHIPAEVSAEALVRTVREFKPHVMITYNEQGGYPHPDHIRCHEISKIAWDRSGDPAAFPEAGEPWAIGKLYYEEIFNGERINTVYQWLVDHEPTSPLVGQFQELRERMGGRGNRSTARIDVGRFFERRDEALRAHASQVPPDSPFFFWPNEVQRQAWPFEDYRLAASRVATSEFEADLFQGIAEEDV